MSRLNVLKSYISSSEQILDALSKQGIVIAEDVVSMIPQPASALGLPEQNDSEGALRLALQNRSLGKPLVDEICKIYQEQSDVWRREVQTQWDTLHTRLRTVQVRTATPDLLRNACRASLSRGLHTIRDQILSVIDRSISAYRRDSEAAASAEFSDSSTDTDDDHARGHGAEALAILEAAYAYTTNITQAEKRKLAQATGLEPRQVVIWFQNRRNRKVKSRMGTAVPGLGSRGASPSADPTRKRKMSCNDAAGPRRPSTFVTPEKKARLHDIPLLLHDRRLGSGTSTTSLGSSVDSRANSLLSDWDASGRYAKQRTASSESTATSYNSPSVCSSFASTPASEHCSPSIRLNAPQASQISGYPHERLRPRDFEQEQALAQYPLGPAASHSHRQSPPIDIAHIFNDGQQSSSLLFCDDSDLPRLDFDDLGLSLADFAKGGSLPFDFAAPLPAGGAQLWQRDASFKDGPSGLMRNQETFAATSASAPHRLSMPGQASTRPHHVTDVAETLSEGNFDMFAALASLPTFQGMSPEAIIQFAASGGQDLSFEAGQQGRSAASPSIFGSSSSSTSQEQEVVTPPSKATDAMSPEDFAFTFHFAELGLDRTFAEIRQSYRVAEEEAKMYSISEMEDEGCGGASSGWETGPEELQSAQIKRFSSSTIVQESPTSSGISSGPWAIPTRPVDLHAQRGTRQAGGRVFGS